MRLEIYNYKSSVSQKSFPLLSIDDAICPNNHTIVYPYSQPLADLNIVGYIVTPAAADGRHVLAHVLTLKAAREKKTKKRKSARRHD